MNVGPGSLLGERYELVALLGRGGMADVFRARDRLLHRDVAVKVLRDSPDTPADRVRFAAEARVLAGLSHPGLVLLLDASSSGDQPYLVLELVVGQTWARELDEGLADPAAAARVGSQVAAALAHAHAAGVVHRDVKPANVLIDDTGRARLADFGIARLVDEHVRHTRTGFTVGTAAYLAPEQVRGEPVTPAVDVYALGLVLLEMLTGERAFPGTSTESAFARLQRSPTIPVSLPRGWPRLLAAMTAADPHERPSAAAAAAALTALADPVAAASDVPDDGTEAVRTVPARRRPLPPLPLLASAAALVLVLVVAGLVGAIGSVDETAAADDRTTPAATRTPERPRASSAKETTSPPTAQPVTATTASQPARGEARSQVQAPPRAKPPGKAKHAKAPKKAKHAKAPKKANHAKAPKKAKPSKGGPGRKGPRGR